MILALGVLVAALAGCAAPSLRAYASNEERRVEYEVRVDVTWESR